MTVYYEKISSRKTEWLFIALTILFLLLFIWRMAVSGWNVVSSVLLVFAVVFLFYSINYRTLVIHSTPESLKLTFGVFTWTVPFSNIESCSLDEIPELMMYGGAGIHFMFVRKRYRASFNFLEYPRVVIAFKNKVGPVRDLSFSTSRPDDVLRFLQEAISA
jgi:Ca2+/Na+ antiporter